ncbi:MAG: hypothetical protein R3C55_12400 [Parvularculaceae bacterium]
MVARNSHVEAVIDSGGFMHGYTYYRQPDRLRCGPRCVLHELVEQDLIGNAARMGDKLKARPHRLDGRLSLHRRRSRQGASPRL